MNTFQTISEQIADVESHIAERNKAIARMERDLAASSESLADKWFRTCSYNLKKARLERDSLQRKLEKLLTAQAQFAQQEQTFLFKKNQAKERQYLELKRIEAAKVARKKNSDVRQLKCIEMNNRKCIELRRLIAHVVGEEQACAMSDQAEKLAWEWVEQRASGDTP